MPHYNGRRFRIACHSNKTCFWHVATKRVVFSLMTGLVFVIWIKVKCDFESEKYHYQYYESQKWQSVVLTVKNENNQWNKSELDSRYLEYECNNRIGDLMSLLPFGKRSIVVCLINQRYGAVYLGNVCF